jgi:replication initiation and membrane attachment protein DnaB
VYTPLIGQKAVNFYVYLCSLSACANKPYQIELEQLLNNNLIDYDEYIDLRRKNEAIGLLSSYSEQNNDTPDAPNLVTINSPRQFSELIKNLFIIETFKANLTQYDFDKLFYDFDDSNLTTNKNNISVDFSYILPNSVANTFAFNLQNLLDQIQKKYKTVVIVDESIVNILKTQCSTLPEQDILLLLNKSVINDPIRKNLVVASNLFNHNLKLLMTGNANQAITFHRNPRIFANKINEDEIKKVFATYQSFSCEQFITNIFKEQPTIEQLQLIEKIRLMGICDDIINMLIDFSVYKNSYGVLNQKYVLSVAKTILTHGYSNLDEVLS